jgi:hypothetical protein
LYPSKRGVADQSKDEGVGGYCIQVRGAVANPRKDKGVGGYCIQIFLRSSISIDVMSKLLVIFFSLVCRSLESSLTCAEELEKGMNALNSH